MLDAIWEYWVLFSAGVFFLLILILMPLSYFVVTRPFDKLVPRGHGPEYDLWFVSVLIFRPGTFAFQIVFPNYAGRNPIVKVNWGGFDFRGHASRLQVIFSYTYIACLYHTVLFFVILFVRDFILG